MGVPLIRTLSPNETRSPEEIQEHYLIEKELAGRLRGATAAERRRLYSAAYEELYRRVPHHSQLRNKVSRSQQTRQIERQLNLLAPWINSQTTFLEIGAGDCALSIAVAAKAAKVFALDVSPTITHATQTPENFTLLLSDGTSIPVPDGSVTVAYSNQLMEHLHPDDALQQLTNIYRALAPGGVYICLTPNRLTGPHDISRYFDKIATGFHLKEYTCSELVSLFMSVGFTEIHHCMRRGAEHWLIPNLLVRTVENSVQNLPGSLAKRASATRLVRGLLEIRLIARK